MRYYWNIEDKTTGELMEMPRPYKSAANAAAAAFRFILDDHRNAHTLIITVTGKPNFYGSPDDNPAILAIITTPYHQEKTAKGDQSNESKDNPASSL